MADLSLITGPGARPRIALNVHIPRPLYDAVTEYAYARCDGDLDRAIAWLLCWGLEQDPGRPGCAVTSTGTPDTADALTPEDFAAIAVDMGRRV